MARRRSPGEGGITKRADGRWEGRLDLGFDQNGKRRRVYIYGKTKKEVTEKLARSQVEKQENRLVVNPEKLNVAQYLDRWFETHASQRLRDSTLAGYRTKIDRHIAPVIGSVPLVKLQALHIQQFYSDKLKEGLSKTTVRQIHAILHAALKRAVKWELIPKNPADAVEAPRPDRFESRVLTAEQAKALLTVSKRHPLHALIVLALTTGMRRGELVGLRWSDIDLERSMLTIVQTMQRITRRKELVVSQPKTLRSRRSVALPPMAVDALREHREQQLHQRAVFGDAYVDQDLVFCREWGVPMDPSRPSRLIGQLTKKAGLPRMRFHDLRHSFATFLANDNRVPLKVVSEMLGHSTIGITADLYSHLLPASRRAAADVIASLLEGESKEAT